MTLFHLVVDPINRSKALILFLYRSPIYGRVLFTLKNGRTSLNAADLDGIKVNARHDTIAPFKILKAHRCSVSFS
jgi:hypothetical protein